MAKPTDEQREAKNAQIKQTLKETHERHRAMLCRVFEIKVVSNKLNRKQVECINGIFREAKWIRNALISDMDSVTGKYETVLVKVGDHFEERSFQYIGSQMKQSCISTVKSEIKGLHTKKMNGYKVGALKYKSYCNSVDLKQHGITYTLMFDKNRIKVQGIRKPLYVRGLKQIPGNAEIANAKFIRKADGLYFHVTCYIPPIPSERTDHIDGYDFGIAVNLTSTEGKQYNVCVPETKRVKLASKRLNRALRRGCKKGSQKYNKLRTQLRVAYLKVTNQRPTRQTRLFIPSCQATISWRYRMR